MRKYTVIKSDNVLHDMAVGLLEMNGYQCTDGDMTFDPKRYMNKTVLLLGNDSVSVETLNELLPRIRTLVYVGENGDIKNAIKEYYESKDIPMMLDNPGITSSIQVYYDAKTTVELYTSPIFSVPELVAKYIASCGPKICLLVKYVVQSSTMRNTAAFDHMDVGDLEPLHDKFMEYHDKCEDLGGAYDRAVLLEIFNENRPV